MEREITSVDYYPMDIRQSSEKKFIPSRDI
jgi:hypothetical protein